VIGEIALIALGHQRTTADLDFLILADSFDKVEKYFLSHGYKCIEKNEHAAIEFIRWMDALQKAVGQFPVSKEKIKGDRFLL